MYVEIGLVSANRQTPSVSSPAPLLHTVQPSGARTSKRYGALRSGCSKLAKTRRASAGSYWVYRYTSPSSGSTKRCMPSPVRE